MAQACGPSTLGGRVGRIFWAQEFKNSLGNIWRCLLLKKNKKENKWELEYIQINDMKC